MPAPLAHTQSGLVSGLRTESGVRIWRGIPYALPPVGSLRFKPPVEEIPQWDGIRDATCWGAKAMQVVHVGAGTLFGPKKTEDRDGVSSGGTPVISEDCLFINVTAPTITPPGGTPVVFWIHGGGFINGSGGDVGDGLNFAEDHGIVFVSFNYRLGSLGFLNLAPLLGEEFKNSGNLGILDQVAALKWVKRNIAAFGGDPARVTIAGVSAGAKSVVTLMAMPSARGLFSRAICESGGGDRIASSKVTAATAIELVALLKLNSPADILTVPGPELVEVAESIGNLGPTRQTWIWLPTIDNDILPTLPIDAIKTGQAANIPLLIGNNSNEAGTYVALDPTAASSARPLLRATLGAQIAESIVAHYKTWQPAMTDHEIDLAIMTDERYGIATLRLADAQSAFAPTYRYYFTAGVPGLPALLTAGHGMEIPYVFDLIGGRGETEVAELARVMGEYWASFVTEGKPSAKGAPEWPEYETGKRETMVLGSRAEVVEDPTRDRHAAWEGVAFETSRWYMLD